jgi:hypothetical protein
MSGIGVGIGTPFGGGRGGGVPINTLIAARGTFRFTGQAATLEVAHEIAAEAGSFEFTGQDATLAIHNHVVDAGHADFVMTGQDATLTVGPPAGVFHINAEFGTFEFSGDTMTPVIDYAIPTEAGSFTMSGTAATLERQLELVAGGASFTFTGQAATLTKSTSYTGPGDIVSGSIGWWSCARAYSAAFAAGGTPIMDLVDQAGANSIAINILSTGFVDTAAISSWVTAHSVTTIRVTKLYDQTGNGLHATNATLATMPALTLNTLNGLPVVTFVLSRGDRLNTGTITQAQPFSMTGVSRRTASFVTESGILGATPTQIDIMHNSTGNVSLRSGSTFSATAANSTWHSIAGVFNGASPNSILVVNGGATTGSSGANAFSAVGLRIGRSSGGGSLDGDIVE